MKPKTQRQLFLVPVESCTATPRVWDMVWARRGRCLSWCVYFTFFIRYPGADWCRRPISRPCPPDFPTCNSSCDTLWKITVRFKKTMAFYTPAHRTTTIHHAAPAVHCTVRSDPYSNYAAAYLRYICKPQGIHSLLFRVTPLGY